jgi:hypothetical protein
VRAQSSLFPKDYFCVRQVVFFACNQTPMGCKKMRQRTEAQSIRQKKPGQVLLMSTETSKSMSMQAIASPLAAGTSS